MCIFCKIINNEIPSKKIYEDDDILAILDISQATKGHTLVIPKKHFDNIFDIEEDTLINITKVINKISKHYKEKLNINNLNILNNSGEVAGQTVNHIHFHIIPRYNSDDITIKFNTNTLEDDLVNLLKI